MARALKKSISLSDSIHKPIHYIKLVENYKRAEKQNSKIIRRFLSGKELEAFSALEALIKEHPLVIQNIKTALELVLLSNEAAIYERIPLSQVEKLYKKLTELYNDDVDLNLEYYYFIKNVMDKEMLAKKFIKKYRKYIMQKIDKAIINE